MPFALTNTCVPPDASWLKYARDIADVTLASHALHSCADIDVIRTRCGVKPGVLAQSDIQLPVLALSAPVPTPVLPLPVVLPESAPAPLAVLPLPSAGAKKRLITISRIVGAVCVAKERVLTDGGILVRRWCCERAPANQSLYFGYGGVASEALRPIAVLSPPVVLLVSASTPEAVLLGPVVLLASANTPVAVLNPPVVLSTSAAARSPCSRHRWCC